MKARKKRMGRPRAFSEEAAIEAAMRTFWQKGFEGTTTHDLTKAMGINRSSMYTIFGDKEAIFRLAFARYVEGPARYMQDALQESTARGVVEALLRGAVRLHTDSANPKGCMFVQGALVCGADGAAMQTAMIGWRKSGEAMFEKRFKRAREENDLPPDLDPGDLARYVATLLTGLGIQAANGANRKQLTRVAELALAGLPL